jgi:hypothetical protein
VTLAPKLPPGRANRKALQFTVEINRLRDAGYTHSAIRLALLDAGVCVSLSTIKRESARRQPSAVPTSRVVVAQPPMLSSAPRVAGPAALPDRPQALPGSRGHDVAEAFFNANPSNPLVRPKEIP